MSQGQAPLTALKNLLRTRVGLALAFTILVSLPFSATEVDKLLHSGAGDFKVYLNAAHVVRNHQSIHIYDGADTGLNPQLRPSIPGSIYFQTALAAGMTDVGLYVYPPTLADAMLPFTFLSLHHARIAWWALNGIALVATALLLVWLFDYPLFSLGALAAIVALLLFRTDLTAMYWGQVTIFLLLLWTAGIVFYVKGYPRTSAMLLAFAAAIKLTPVLVLLPFIFWKDWRWVRWFLGSVLACILLICAVNGTAPLADFAFHVMPPMSAGIPGILNTSLPGAIEMLAAGIRGVDVEHVYFITVPSTVVLFAKLLSLAVLVAAAVAIFRVGTNPSRIDRARILALVALLSTCISPVAWRHAYTVVVPLLFLLWSQALRHRPSNLWLAMLIFSTLEFGFILDTVAAKVAHGVFFSAVPLIGPLCALVILFHELAAMRVSSSVRLPQSMTR